MSNSTYLYAITRDFGFAPNPFHGVCTLATCKPDIRSTAQPGDWIFSMGGSKMGKKTANLFGHCICAMRVSRKISFSEYWNDPEFDCKRPVRNGSRRSLVGDNVYHMHAGSWIQADCHHSHPDGSPNESNIKVDTKSDCVLISDYFIYFGKSAPRIPQCILDTIPYRQNYRGHRRYRSGEADVIVVWLHENYSKEMNLVLGDPFLFNDSEKRYSAGGDKIL